ncbi:MAG TPA: hypothetical protein VEB42_04455, partial [Chitinophagaceae bacterium]|nr:hypothetical protein [Chitinophagaceae bacterium]
MLAPANGVSSTDTLQTFYWELANGATQYELQVVSPGFDSIVQLIADTTTARNRVTMPLLRNSEYR